MRGKLLRHTATVAFIFLYPLLVQSQSCITTGINGTVINLSCNQACSNLNFQVPHLKSTTNYTLNTIAYNPFPYTSPSGTELTLLYADDEYSNVVNFPFSFCFYGINYSSLVVGSNGLLTFDVSNAAPCDNAYMINTPGIPGSGGGPQCSAGTTYYPRAAIMGNFSDLDPRSFASPGDRKIEWRVEGTSPCRKLIVSYFHVGIFGVACGQNFPNTFQMILHESTGVIEIFTAEKTLCNSSTSQGRSIMGIQNWDRTEAVPVPGRNATQWTVNNEGLRFTPSGGLSRYVVSQLYTLGGVLVATADTTTTVPGMLDLQFLNVCVPSTTNTYVVKTTYSACDNPAIQLISNDTITVNITGNLNATGSGTNTGCGAPSGTITITVPPGSGASPYTYVLDGGTPVTAPSPYTFNNVGAGLHTITVTDATGSCTSTLQVTVNQTGVLAATATPTSTTCAGANNGTISVVPSGGTAPFTFTLNPGAIIQTGNTALFTNLAANTYSITVTDASGCTTNPPITVTVTAGAPLTANVSSTATSCSGASNGTITVTPNNGTGPYTFALDGGAPQTGTPPFVFNNVPAGLHTIIVTDAAGCTTNPPITVTVVAGAPLTATANPTATSCSGASNGSISVTPNNGTAPYTFTLNPGGIIQTGNTALFTNLAANTYSVSITDASGCATNPPVSVTVVAGAPLTASVSSTATSCSGASNGTITVTPNNGTGPYTFALDGGAPQTGALPFVFNNVPAGLHTIIVTDAAGCTTNPPITVTVVAGAPLTATVNPTATSCDGAANGTITVTPNNGTGPYTFVLDGGAPQSGPLPFVFNNVPAGLHTINVTDASGCTTNPPITVTVDPGAPLTASVSATATSCDGASNGTITVTPNNGTAPYTFTLNPGGIIQTGNTALFTNVAANTYSVNVTDASGCATNPPVSVTVVAGAPLTASASATATSCDGASNGTITVTPNNGTAPYTFTLNPGGIIQTGNTALFTNLAANTYTVNVTDASGCATNPPVSATVVAGAPLTANVSSTATSCDGASNGTITVTPNNGTAPYTFTLNPGGIIQTGNTALFTNLAANTYTVNVTDASGCATNPPVSVTVVAGAPLTANVSATATSCNGASNGTITVNPNNGTAPFSFSLDGGAPQSGPPPYIFNNVAPGMHTINVIDASGCITGSIPVNVAAGPNLTTTVTKTDVLCNGGATGSITVTQPTMGTPPFEYAINGGPWQTSNIFAGLAAATYTISYREANGCLGSQPVTIAEPPVLDGSISSIPVTCNGQNNGTISLTATGGVGPYQYSINGGGSWQSSPVFQVGAGSYTVLIRDANNCSISRTEVITEPAVLTASATLTDASCDGGNDGTITVTAAGGNSSYQYSLNGGTFQSSNLFNVTSGLYTIIVRDNLGCTTSFDTTVNLSGNLVLTPQTDPTICESQSVQLQVNSNATSYSWQAAPSLSNLSVPNPVANPTVTTQYIVTVTLGACSQNDTVIVNVNPAPVPDAGPGGLICYGQTYTLQGSGGTQFSWSPSNYLNSSTIANPVSSPTSTITYTLSVIDANGCSSLVTDDVTVDVTPPIKVYTFPYDTVAHAGDSFRILATSIAPQYQWSPSIGLNSDTIPNPVVTVGNVGDDRVYKVTAYNATGCRGEGYVRVRVFKGPELYIPTAFTPNNDGKNDKFVPFPVGVKKLNYFRVFNRWGQLIYSTNELHRGWDGTFGGKEQPSGVYVWMAEGVTLDNRVISHTGTVVLIR